MHQLAQQGIAWEDFISRDFFSALQPPPEIVHDEGGPSQQFDIPETEHVDPPVYVTYQKGPRALFAAARRVLSPPGVEGSLLPTSATQVQGRGKEPMHDEGPSGERETDFILIHDDDTNVKSAKLRRIIQE